MRNFEFLGAGFAWTSKLDDFLVSKKEIKFLAISPKSFLGEKNSKFKIFKLKIFAKKLRIIKSCTIRSV